MLRLPYRRRFAPAWLCLLALLGAHPARAQTPLSCRLGPFAKEGHLLAETLGQVANARMGRVEYRLRVRNPHAWPAAVLPGISLPGVVEAPAQPITIPPREAREVLVGWVPLAAAPRQGANPGPVPGVDAVRAALRMPFCTVLAPEGSRAASGHPAVAAGGVQVIRDEGAEQILQRL